MKYQMTVFKTIEVEALTMQKAIEKIRTESKYKGFSMHSITELDNDTMKVSKESDIEEVNKGLGLLGVDHDKI